MQTASITQLLQGQVATGQQVEIRGWVRTRRDSKAGLSFIQVSDGSCQGTIQVVAKNDLPNYADGVQKLTAGSSLVVRGVLVDYSDDAPGCFAFVPLAPLPSGVLVEIRWHAPTTLLGPDGGIGAVAFRVH